MNTLPLAVILLQSSPEIEQSQTEHSFSPLHFSKQIMVIPLKKKTIKIAVATVHVNDVPQYYTIQK